MWKIIFLIIIFILFFFAVRTKRTLQRMRTMAQLENAVDSPTSVAIGELVAIAGGIYLSLILLTSFLKVNMPARISFYDWSVDYLAAIAFAIALFQPILTTLYYKVMQKR